MFIKLYFSGLYDNVVYPHFHTKYEAAKRFHDIVFFFF